MTTSILRVINIFFPGSNNSSASTSASARKRPTECVSDYPPPKKRKMWNEEEEDHIMQFFNLEMTSPPPSLDDCGWMLTTCPEQSFIGRSKKDVQDKCQTIIRQRRKRGVGLGQLCMYVVIFHYITLLWHTEQAFRTTATKTTIHHGNWISDVGKEGMLYFNV